MCFQIIIESIVETSAIMTSMCLSAGIIAATDVNGRSSSSSKSEAELCGLWAPGTGVSTSLVGYSELSDSQLDIGIML